MEVNVSDCVLACVLVPVLLAEAVPDVVGVKECVDVPESDAVDDMLCEAVEESVVLSDVEPEYDPVDVIVDEAVVVADRESVDDAVVDCLQRERTGELDAR